MLQLESTCLAKYTDGIWYKGKVVDVHDDGHYTVMFDSYNDETFSVDVEDIIPTGINKMLFQYYEVSILGEVIWEHCYVWHFQLKLFYSCY